MQEYYTAAGRPHGILINLGTNDWGHVKSNVSGFVAVYAAFVKDLAALHGYPVRLNIVAGHARIHLHAHHIAATTR
jgi:hypothetical protein